MTPSNIALKCNDVKKSPAARTFESNQKSSRSGSLAEIIPDWPQLKSFDRTQIKKKVTETNILLLLKMHDHKKLSQSLHKSGINFSPCIIL